jgi:O-methyltransferase involved in polyketide biosynthesis
MRKSQSSLTAIGITIVRAIESAKPETERICYDPYARHFVNGALYHFVKFFDRLGYSERKSSGVTGFLTVRERHIGAHAQRTVADGYAIASAVVMAPAN